MCRCQVDMSLDVMAKFDSVNLNLRYTWETGRAYFRVCLGGQRGMTLSTLMVSGPFLSSTVPGHQEPSIHAQPHPLLMMFLFYS